MAPVYTRVHGCSGFSELRSNLNPRCHVVKLLRSTESEA